MVAHDHGQNINAFELSRSLEVRSTSEKRYLDILSGVFIIRQLQPWFETIKKRQVKISKIHYWDRGRLIIN